MTTLPAPSTCFQPSFLHRLSRRTVGSVVGVATLTLVLCSPSDAWAQPSPVSPRGMTIIATRHASAAAELAVFQLVGRTSYSHISAVLTFMTLTGSRERAFGPFHTLVGSGITSPNGQWLLYSDWSGRVHLMNLATKRERLSTLAGTGAFSYDSRYIVFDRTNYAADAESLSIYKISSRHFSPVGGGLRIGFAGKANGNFAPGFAWAHDSDRLVFTIAPPRPGPWSGSEWLGVVSAQRPSAVHRIRIGEGVEVSPPAWSWGDRGLLYWRIERNGRVGLVLRHSPIEQG